MECFHIDNKCTFDYISAIAGGSAASACRLPSRRCLFVFSKGLANVVGTEAKKKALVPTWSQKNGREREAAGDPSFLLRWRH